MNIYDSNRIYDLTSRIGFKKTYVKEEADCFILNTCHIREKATEKVYDEIGRIKKDFKKKKKPLVIVSGCVAQAESEEIMKREPYVDILIGPQSYHKISDLILSYSRKKQKINETEFDVVNKFDELEKVSNLQNKISSYLTIQEGCDKFCHFCVVPYTRGPEYSAYNFSKNNKNFTLSSLIRELNNIKNLKRIRYVTSHPKDMTEDLINCHKDCEKLMPIIHLPIQSGSDKILTLMNRKHNRNFYLSAIKKLKNVNKDIKISSDFIIGYPGETEKDFEETLDLIQKIGFVNSYSFIFSPRPGTPAAEKKLNNLSKSKKRLIKLQDILEKLQLENNKNYLKQYCEVLIENKLDNQEKYFGRTKYMTPVIFDSNNCNPGELINVKITSFNQNNLFGFHKTNKVQAA